MSSPLLTYETEVDDEGVDAVVYHHPDHDETIVGMELGRVDNPDEWEMRWYCPDCGVRDPPEDELEPAGWTSIHLPCATEEELEQARVQESRVAENLRNAEGLEEGAYEATHE